MSDALQREMTRSGTGCRGATTGSRPCTFTCMPVTSAPLDQKNFPQRGQQLPQLCGHRAVCGVDNDTPHLVVRHLAGFGQVMGGGSRVNLLQRDKALGVRCESF